MNIPHGPLSTANFVQQMAKQQPNEKLALALQIGALVLVGKLIYDQFNLSPLHRKIEEHERRYHRHDR